LDCVSTEHAKEVPLNDGERGGYKFGNHVNGIRTKGKGQVGRKSRRKKGRRAFEQRGSAGETSLIRYASGSRNLHRSQKPQKHRGVR